MCMAIDCAVFRYSRLNTDNEDVYDNSNYGPIRLS